MADRVLATGQAREAAQQLTAATKELMGQIEKVLKHGEVLAQKDQWDGQHADKWRTEWQADSKQLKQASNKINEIDDKAKQAVTEIIRAGGGG